MSLPIICLVSGTLLDATGSTLSGINVNAKVNRPYIDPTSGALIPNQAIQTITDGNGAWSMSLIETTTANVGVTFSFLYSSDQNNSQQNIYEYTVLIPATTSATFSSLVGTQK